MIEEENLFRHEGLPGTGNFENNGAAADEAPNAGEGPAHFGNLLGELH